MPAADALDKIALRLAGGMSRRQALLKGGAAFVGAMTAPAAEAFASATGRCPTGRVSCNGKCCPTGQVCKTVRKNGKKVKTCACPAHTTKCHNKCVNTKTDSHNCGACGHRCTGGHVCHSGRCVCPRGTTLCNGSCVTLGTDPHNCGACGHHCPSGQVCGRGQCAAHCPSGTVNCNGACVDTASDGNNCGACGHVCPSGMFCASGTCSATCPTGTVACAGGCVNTATDNDNCGTCGKICSGQLVCQSGTCQTCSSPAVYCNGTCSNFQTDSQNCGSCGSPCQSGQYCNSGTCSNCPPNQVGCGGACHPGTGCCGQNPQTVHNNGVGGFYYDCGAQGIPGHANTYSQAMGLEAAASWSNQTPSRGTCHVGGATYDIVVVQDPTGSSYGAWAYDGPYAGHVKVNAGGPVCPTASSPSWN